MQLSRFPSAVGRVGKLASQVFHAFHGASFPQRSRGKRLVLKFFTPYGSISRNMTLDVALLNKRGLPEIAKQRFTGGRRRRRGKMELTERLVLALTKEEKRRIEDKARELGVSMTYYAVQKLLEGTEPPRRKGS